MTPHPCERCGAPLWGRRRRCALCPKASAAPGYATRRELERQRCACGGAKHGGRPWCVACSPYAQRVAAELERLEAGELAA